MGDRASRFVGIAASNSLLDHADRICIVLGLVELVLNLVGLRAVHQGTAMVRHREHPSVACSITVALVAVLVAALAYPLSYGPAWWIVSRLSARDLMPQSVADGLWTFCG